MKDILIIKKIFYNTKFKNILCISMIPYPSGNLHVGHIRNYSISDIFNRFLKLNKFNINTTTGWDCFGTPAENAAINKFIIPYLWIKKNIIYMKKQLKNSNFSLNWKNVFFTCNEKYYKWNQWIFLKLLKFNFIYIKKKEINWDPVDKTVLSNEQVLNGFGWRSGALVLKKKKNTYFLKILNYKNELLKELKNLNWPISVKNMQNRWIGKNFLFKLKIFIRIKNLLKNFYIFNFNIKKLFYIFFILKKNFYFKKVIIFNKNFKIYKKKIFLEKIKVSNLLINTGLYIESRFILKKIEILLNKEYNKNDFYIFYKNNFLNFFNKKIDIFNYKNFSNLNFQDIYNLLKKKRDLIKVVSNWKLLNWGISRQRYWGTPIPIINCLKCKRSFANIQKVILPKKLKPIKKTNCLKKNKNFLSSKCFFCKNIAKKESDTMDTFFDSSWYFLRIINLDNNKIINKYINKLLPVDLYIGGIEHSILHLLYCRFVTKFLRDIKLINFGEPIKKLYTQGMVLNQTFYKKNINNIIEWVNENDLYKKLSKDKNSFNFFLKSTNEKIYTGNIEKMSKSKNNGVDPFFFNINSDSLRLFVVSYKPLNKDLFWNKEGLKLGKNFLIKFWKYYYINKSFLRKKKIFKNSIINFNNKKFLYYFYEKLKKINSFYLNLCYNNIFSYCFKIFNILKKINIKNFLIMKECFSILIRVLYPIIPDITFKIWNNLKFNKNLGFLLNTFWPRIYKLKIKKYFLYILFINNKKLLVFKLKNISEIYIKSKIFNYLFFKKKCFNKLLINNVFFKKNIINVFYNNVSK